MVEKYRNGFTFSSCVLWQIVLTGMPVAASKRGGERYHRERRERERRKKDITCARACEREKEKTKAKRGWNYHGREIRRVRHWGSWG